MPQLEGELHSISWNAMYPPIAVKAMNKLDTMV
jgi:hypothetical protein